ncbi:hypothetical protein DBV15_05760 [Temnothorax longispinosus]|uniref:Uncharacterized protein n=1 Tax=Temnothorax longispinosus TaxID=300112 RepID=A0A4S2KJA5_9HYME|nr:hypothetical protein DBV15_05760 [Temnothorax longispinosus]
MLFSPETGSTRLTDFVAGRISDFDYTILTKRDAGLHALSEAGRELKRRINKQKRGGRRRMKSGALQDFPILCSARDCVYLRFAGVLRRRKLHVPKTDC